jgi:hypothetical protein
MNRRFASVIIASLGLALAACQSKSGGDGAGGNPSGPSVPGQNNSVYTPQPPPTASLEIRNMNGTLSGRKLNVSIVEFRPGKNQPLVAGVDAYFYVDFSTSDGQPCNCTLFVQAMGANSVAEAAAGHVFPTSFWGSGYTGGEMKAATHRIRVGSQASGPPVNVPFVLSRFWAVQAIGSDVRAPKEDAYATIVSDEINWRAQ